MKLRAFGFSGNGLLQGSIAALDDSGDPLGWEHRGNWSSTQVREKAVKDLALTVGISEDKARKAMTDVLREARKLAGFPDDGAPQRPQHELPVIELTGKQPREIVAESWEVLRQANAEAPEFFTFGNLPVHLDHDSSIPYLHVITLAGMRRHLNTRADYVREERGEERPAIVPRTALEEVLATERLPLPYVKGVSYTPVLAPSGAIVAASGYSKDLELYLSVPPNVVIPESVGGGDIRRALSLLRDELLGDFRFATEADGVHALALLLVPLVRPAIDGPVPMHDIEAPTPGSGKNLLANVAGILATGSPPPAMTEARDQDEWRKRITSVLRQAPTMILIDNVRRKLDSAHLASVLTTSVWRDRELGRNQTLTLPNVAVWMMTANNPTFSGEMVDRILRIRIDAHEERPRERTGFKHDPLLNWVQEQRGQLLGALLTPVRAWVQAGRPRGDAVWGSFESYANTIGGILKVAGVEGFLQNRQEVYQSAESEETAWLAFFETWWETYQDQRVAMDKLFDLAKDKKLLTELRGGRVDLGARTSMGIELAGMRDRVIGAYIIRRVGETRTGASVYRLHVKSGTETGYAGYAPSAGPQIEEYVDPAYPAYPKTPPLSTQEQVVNDDASDGSVDMEVAAASLGPSCHRCACLVYEIRMDKDCPDCRGPICLRCGNCKGRG